MPPNLRLNWNRSAASFRYPLRDERTRHRMADLGTGGASFLTEVALVLVQQRRQYGAADRDVREVIGGSRAKSLSLTRIIHEKWSGV
jgi:hypothetical protein